MYLYKKEEAGSSAAATPASGADMESPNVGGAQREVS
jgi:hypothetical protein